MNSVKTIQFNNTSIFGFGLFREGNNNTLLHTSRTVCNYVQCIDAFEYLLYYCTSNVSGFDLTSVETSIYFQLSKKDSRWVTNSRKVFRFWCLWKWIFFSGELCNLSLIVFSTWQWSCLVLSCEYHPRLLVHSNGNISYDQEKRSQRNQTMNDDIFLSYCAYTLFVFLQY